MNPHLTAEYIAKNWSLFDHGTTIGKRGSEEGIILRDEEHDRGARITLERDAPHGPFALTCGIYGSLLHTAFASSETDANRKDDEMKMWLDRLLTEGMSKDEYWKNLDEFVNRF